MRNGFVVLLILTLTITSLIMVESASAQSIPKPSVPIFTVKFVNASYPVTTTNPYTGLSATTLSSNNSIQITIKNQPLSTLNNQICYNIQVKPHFTGNWTELYPIENWTSAYNRDGTFSFAEYINYNSPHQSTSSYTIVTFPVVATDIFSAPGYDIQMYFDGYQYTEGTYTAFLRAIPAGAQIDFQVEALIGHASQTWIIEHPFYPTIGGHFAPAVAYDVTSGWSNIQTTTIPETSTSTSPNPTSTPAVPEFYWLAVIPLVIGMFFVAVLLRHRKTTNCALLRLHSLC